MEHKRTPKMKTSLVSNLNDDSVLKCSRVIRDFSNELSRLSASIGQIVDETQDSEFSVTLGFDLELELQQYLSEDKLSQLQQKYQQSMQSITELAYKDELSVVLERRLYTAIDEFERTTSTLFPEWGGFKANYSFSD